MDKKGTDYLLVLAMILGAFFFVVGSIIVKCCSASPQQSPVPPVEPTLTVVSTPTAVPTVVPTVAPTVVPTVAPTVVPTVVPTELEEILQILDLSDEQVQIALGDSSDEKMQLLESSELHPNGLLALCIKPLNLEDSTIQNLYEEAFDRIDLTEDQRVRIANLGNPLFSTFLLRNASPLVLLEELPEICAHSDGFDFKDPSVIELFERAFYNAYLLTEEQQVRIANLGKPLFSTFLLRDAILLEPEALLEIYAHSDGFDFKDPSVIELFERAFDKSSRLTEEQQVRIAKLRNPLFSMFLLKNRRYLSSEGLVALCENFDCFDHYNLDEPIEFHAWSIGNEHDCYTVSIKELFKKAIGLTDLTDEQKDRIANSPACVLGLL